VADDYQDLGSYERFPLLPNWASPPDSNYLMARWLVNMAGTVDTLKSITDNSPIIFESTFTITDKQEEYDLLDFFYNRRGRHGKFWIQHPATCFTLKKTANLGGLEISCYPNRAQLSYQGYERIYVYMSNGDIITREIPNVTYDAVDDELDLELVTALDRDITTDNCVMIGRMLLVRFEDDSMEFESHTSEVTEVTLRFHELVEEYDDV